MVWHAFERKKDGKLRHAADGEAWKTIPNHKWRFDKRRFNGEVETGTSAPMLTGRQVAEILNGYQNSFGRDNLTRHNLDVMHIEKNICDSVLGTLLNIGVKTKDHLAASLDLQDQGIRKALHPMPSTDGKNLEFRAAKFDMTNKEKEIFCSVLQNAKFPYGFASNISKCLQDRKVMGHKSHNTHVIIQYLLKFAIKVSLKPEVAVPLIRLGEFFRCICSKVIELDEIKRSKPEGSIAEGYLAHKCLTFYARFLNDDQNKSVNESPSVNAEKGGYAIGLGKSKYGKDINLGEDTWIMAHRYILFNYDDKEMEDLIDGEFMKTRYSGGKVEIFYVDRDRLSYCEMMDYVKELNYKEIGGLYVNRRGWTLVTDDQGVNEATRDKSDVSFYIDNIVDKSIPPMKTFVTLKDINNEKERRKSTRKKLKFNTYHDVSSKYQPSPTGAVEPSPKAAVEPSPKVAVQPSPKCAVEKSPEIIVKDIDGSGTGAGQITFLESGGSREMLKEVEGDGCNDYEKRRNKNVAKNKAKLQALGLCRTKPASETKKRKAKQPNEDGAESDYISDNDQERQKKAKKQRVIPSNSGGPRTRGQANKLVEESQNKEPTMGSPDHVDEINETPVLTVKEKLQALKYGLGSMVAYNELRKCEKLGIHKEIPKLESGTQQVISESRGLGDTPVGEARKRKRGRTKMNHVHNNTEKKVITLNDQFQPVSCGGKWSIAEFNNFLGTTLWQFVSLTCASWYQVPEKELLWEINTLFRKRLNRGFLQPWVISSGAPKVKNEIIILKYATDEKRLRHRPRDVSLKNWKILLTYWGDENGQLLDRLDKLHLGIDDDELEELLKVSDADVYLETHKRDDKHSYKLPDEMAIVVNEKIFVNSGSYFIFIHAKVQKTLQTDGVDATNELVHDTKEHHPSYMIGRLVCKKYQKPKSPRTPRTISVPVLVPEHDYAKIRAQLQKEMDEKLDQRVREMMKILAEQNPNLNSNLNALDKSTEDLDGS
ncbi:hypothetical protein AgCh_023983 [Apium graveolens]